MVLTIEIGAVNQTVPAQILADAWSVFVSLDKHLELRNRTKKFALRVVRMSRVLPNNREANIISSQIIRSATSMAANYRAAGLARSKPEFLSKLGVVVEEADETVFWLEFLAELGIVKPTRLKELQAEAKELVAIFVASLPREKPQNHDVCLS